MDTVLYPTHPGRCVFAGRSEYEKSCFLTKFISNIINVFGKIFYCSPSLHQDSCQKLIKCCSNFLPIISVQNIFNEEDLDVIIEEIGNNENFEKSELQIETHQSIEEMKYPQEFESDFSILTTIDDLGEKAKNDPRFQAIFKSLSHRKVFIFMFSQSYYELPKLTSRANGKWYSIF